MTFSDKVIEAGRKVQANRQEAEESREAAARHAKAAVNRLREEIGNTDHIYVQLRKAEGEGFTYFPPTIQVSFYIERRGLFSKKKNNYSGYLIEVYDHDGQPRYLDMDRIPSYGNKKDGTYVEGSEYIRLDTSRFEELLDYIAEKYSAWKSIHAASR